MIDIRKVEDEPSRRDVKRKRLILKIGKLRFHISRGEARSMRNKLNRFKLD